MFHPKVIWTVPKMYKSHWSFLVMLSLYIFFLKINSWNVHLKLCRGDIMLKQCADCDVTPTDISSLILLICLDFYWHHRLLNFLSPLPIAPPPLRYKFLKRIGLRVWGCRLEQLSGPLPPSDKRLFIWADPSHSPLWALSHSQSPVVKADWAGSGNFTVGKLAVEIDWKIIIFSLLAWVIVVAVEREQGRKIFESTGLRRKVWYPEAGERDTVVCVINKNHLSSNSTNNRAINPPLLQIN